METSAKTGEGVDDLFFGLSRKVLDRILQQEKAKKILPSISQPKKKAKNKCFLM